MNEKESGTRRSVLNKPQKKCLVVHASNLMDLFEAAEFSGSHMLEPDFFENHVNKFDLETLVSTHKSIKKNRKIMDYPVPAFLSTCPKDGSLLYNEFWLTKARVWYLYKRYHRRYGFNGLVLRMLDSVRLIIERDEIRHLYNHLFIVRGIENELANIKSSEKACRNNDADLAYLRKISPYRIMLAFDAIDQEENPRPSFRNKKEKKSKKPKKGKPPIDHGIPGQKFKKKSRPVKSIRKSKNSAHGRLQHLEKKSKSLTTNASIPSDMAVQELLKKLVVPPPMDKRAAYTAIAYSLIFGASLRKMFDAQSNEFVSIIVDILDKSATTRCRLKADPDERMANLFNSSSQHNGVRIRSNILECLDSAWGLRDFLSEDGKSIVHDVGLILKSVRSDGFYMTSSGLSKYRAAWLANRNLDYAEISLLHGEANPDAAGVHYHQISTQQLQRTHDRFEQYIGHGIEELNQRAEHEGQTENVV